MHACSTGAGSTPKMVDIGPREKYIYCVFLHGYIWGGTQTKTNSEIYILVNWTASELDGELRAVYEVLLYILADIRPLFSTSEFRYINLISDIFNIFRNLKYTQKQALIVKLSLHDLLMMYTLIIGGGGSPHYNFKNRKFTILVFLDNMYICS